MEILKEIGYKIGMELPELLSSFLIMWGILQCKLKKSIIPHIVAIISLMLIFTWTVLSGNQDNLPPICTIAELIVVLLCFEERVAKKITLYLISYVSSYIISALIASILSLVFNINEAIFWEKDKLRILIMAINICFVLFFSIIIKNLKKGIADWIKKISLRYYVAELFGLLCCVLVLAFVQTGRTDSINNIKNKVAVLSVTLVCIFFIVGSVVLIIINDSRKYFQMQNQLKEKYINMQQNYYKKIIDSDHEIRKFRHDMKAHMGCIRILSESRRYQELSSYITNVSNEVDILLTRNIRSGNDTLDTLINYMEPEAEQEGIHIILDGSFPKNVKVTEIDLCTIFSNTISNAIEACRCVESEVNKNIYVRICINKDNLYITIENLVQKPVDVKMLGRGTTKNDKQNHGLGMQNIMDIVKKYKGNIMFINEEGRFRVEILLLEVL